MNKKITKQEWEQMASDICGLRHNMHSTPIKTNEGAYEFRKSVEEMEEMTGLSLGGNIESEAIYCEKDECEGEQCNDCEEVYCEFLDGIREENDKKILGFIGEMDDAHGTDFYPSGMARIIWAENV